MSRLLILAAVLIGVVLLAAGLLSGGGGPPESTDGRRAGAREDDTPAVDVAALAGGERTPIRASETTWNVTVVDEGGVAIPEARIVGTAPSRQQREATGQASWSDVEPGVWWLAVTAPGRPLWRDRIEIAEGAHTETRVQIAPGVLVDGRVRDAAGLPCRGRIVGFVPSGARAPEQPARWLELPHTRAKEDGTFRMLLPGEGEWRLFVGWGGEVAFEEPAPTRLTTSGPSFVDVTVPSPTRLVALVTDAPGVERTGAHGFSVYREATRVAADRPDPNPRRPAPPSVGPGILDEDAVAEREAEERHLAEVPMDEDSERRRLLRVAVVPDGWAKEKSGICSAKGRIDFERLPVDEELRFAVSRGSEAFAVDGSAFLAPSATVVVRIELPAPLPGDAPLPDAPRRVQARVDYPQPSLPPRAVGAVWR